MREYLLIIRFVVAFISCTSPHIGCWKRWGTVLALPFDSGELVPEFRHLQKAANLSEDNLRASKAQIFAFICVGGKVMHRKLLRNF